MEDAIVNEKPKIKAIRLEHRGYVVGQRPSIPEPNRLSVLEIELFMVPGSMGWGSYERWFRVHFTDPQHGMHEVNGSHVHIIEYEDKETAP